MYIVEISKIEYDLKRLHSCPAQREREREVVSVCVCYIMALNIILYFVFKETCNKLERERERVINIVALNIILYFVFQETYHKFFSMFRSTIRRGKVYSVP